MPEPPPDPCRPEAVLAPFQATLDVPRAHRLGHNHIHDIDIGVTHVDVAPGLRVPAWGYGMAGHAVTSPGPLLEAEVNVPVIVRWANRLPASRLPGETPPELPFATSLLSPPNDPQAQGEPQNRTGTEGGPPEDMLAMAPVGWTTTHLHGAHSDANSDGFPDNMIATGDAQLDHYRNTYDNTDLGLLKVGAFLWYHDHAMNGTGYHVFAGLLGGYLLRDPAEAALGLPVGGDEGEVVLVIQDRNLDCTDGCPRYLHKTTMNLDNDHPGTAEFFGPLTVVNQRLWPRLPLRPEVYRLRLLNGSNARAYRFHLVAIDPDTGKPVPRHARLLVIGTEGGLLWRASPLADTEALTLAPAERIDVLLDLTGLPEGAQLHLINSAEAPFHGIDKPDLATLETLWATGDPAQENRIPYPWVMRFDVHHAAPTPGKPKSLFQAIQGVDLNPSFRRLVHTTGAPGTGGGPPELGLPDDHEHRLILLGEQPAGKLFLQELVTDPGGEIEIQLPGEKTPTKYRVDGWMPTDTAHSNTRVPFYDHIAIRPTVRHWEVWRFLNTTGDVHPMHIHQSIFQPLGPAAALMVVDDGAANNPRPFYDPETRKTSQPLLPEPGGKAGRTYDPHETRGWKDVIRVHPSQLVEVAIRFDIPGRYVYHCHVLEHEDNVMMRPFVVTVMPMDDTAMGSMGHSM